MSFYASISWASRFVIHALSPSARISKRLPMRRTGRGGRFDTLPLMMLWTCAFEQRSSRATSAMVNTAGALEGRCVVR